MTRDIEAKIVAFVATKSGIPSSKIDSNSRLLQDLGIDGDDAGELMQFFAKQFDVAMSEFDFARYFRAEPSLSRLFKSAEARRCELDSKIPISVLDLVESAGAHLWICPSKEKGSGA